MFGLTVVDVTAADTPALGLMMVRVTIESDRLPGRIVALSDGVACSTRGHGCSIPTRLDTQARWLALDAARVKLWSDTP